MHVFDLVQFSLRQDKELVLSTCWLGQNKGPIANFWKEKKEQPKLTQTTIEKLPCGALKCNSPTASCIPHNSIIT